MARQAIYTGNSGFDLPSHQLLSNPSQYRNTTWKLCRSPLLERRNPPIERHPPFSPEFIRHLPYPDDKLLANPVTHHHLPIYFFPYLSFPLLPPPEIESPVWKIIRNNQTPGMEFYDDKRIHHRKSYCLWWTGTPAKKKKKPPSFIFGKLQKTLRSFNPAKSKFFRATNLPVDEFWR